MKHTATTIFETGISIRFSDATDATKANEWIDLRVKTEDLKLASGTVISQPETQSLAVLKVAALLHAREAIEAEIERLRNLRLRTA
jgi:hypothetical protein